MDDIGGGGDEVRAARAQSWGMAGSEPFGAGGVCERGSRRHRRQGEWSVAVALWCEDLTLVAQIIHEELNEKKWEEDKVPAWMTSITEKCTEALADLGKPFKYIVTCMIMQDTGAGVSSAPVASFDGVSDGLVAVSWPNDKARETASLYCIVTVCGMALFSR
jgi:dynein light chain Tctex-type 1